MIRICFVCLGNICRSPTAEAAMRKRLNDSALADRIEVDSAGTAAYHAGEPADERSAAAALQRGVQLTSVARQFTAADFDRFDYVIAMDRQNRETLRERAASPEDSAKVELLRSYDPDCSEDADVPDPYYGGPHGFDHVFEICDSGCAGLLAHIRDRHDL
jgi:protein-tyrosine phosphatase